MITLGSKNNVDERCKILDSRIGHDNSVEINVKIENCSIGNSNHICHHCELVNISMGDCCHIGSKVKLRDQIIPDGTSIFLCQGRIVFVKCNTTLQVS
jgi:NDP-sugar pyrophosphorylase family protein